MRKVKDSEKEVADLKEQTDLISTTSIEVVMKRGELDELESTFSAISHRLAHERLEQDSQARINIIQKATPPAAPDRSSRLQNTISAGLFGFLAPVGLLLWWDVRARKINSVHDISHGLKLRVIGTVPHITDPAASRIRLNSRRQRQTQICLDHSIDGIAAKLCLRRDSRNARVVLVSSATHGEGKSTLSIQLAKRLARTGARTLLVDFDLRKPTLHRVFDLPRGPGLSDFLRGDGEFAALVNSTEIENLSILTAGSPFANSLGTLANGVTRSLFEKVREDYAFVVVDGSPILPVVDSLLASQHVDSVVLSIRRDVSQISRRAGRLRSIGAIRRRRIRSCFDGIERRPLYYYDDDHQYAALADRKAQGAVGGAVQHEDSLIKTRNGHMILVAIMSLVVATLAGAVFTALMIRIAPRLGLVDRPDQRRKLHVDSMPLGGGVAVFLATVCVLGGLVLLPGPWQFRINEEWWNLVGSFVACAWIVTLGLIDDRYGTRGRQKLAGQVFAAGLLMACGILIRKVSLFGIVIDLGPLAIPLTLFWLLGAMNSLNLLDGMDGMATVLGIILSLSICVLAVISHHAGVALAALIFAGGLLGFLPFNLAPAKIYLGDAGSMLIGLIVGGLAIRASLKGPGTMLLAAPLALLTIPILDSTAAILRRKLAGRSLYETDRGHLHHRLLERFGSKYKALACVAICSGVTCAGALLGSLIKSDLVALVALTGVVLILVTTGLFGRGEFGLLAVRLRDTTVSLLRPVDPRLRQARETTARFQGSREWDVLWATLTESAEKLQLTKIHLDLNVPAIAESFHASWSRNGRDEHENEWKLKLPLAVAGHAAGSLTIVGQRNDDSACPRIELILEMLEPFEARLRDLTLEEIMAKVGEHRLVAEAVHT